MGLWDGRCWESGWGEYRKAMMGCSVNKWEKLVKLRGYVDEYCKENFGRGRI